MLRKIIGPNFQKLVEISRFENLMHIEILVGGAVHFPYQFFPEIGNSLVMVGGLEKKSLQKTCANSVFF